MEGLLPAHDDEKESLSIGIGDGGRVLLNCHAGCSSEDILAAMGLTMRDLYPHKKVDTRELPSCNQMR